MVDLNSNLRINGQRRAHGACFDRLFRVLIAPVVGLAIIVADGLVQLTSLAGSVTPWSSLFERQFKSGVNEEAIKILAASCSLSPSQATATAHLLDEHIARFDRFVESSRPKVLEQDKNVSQFIPNTPERVIAEFERERILSDVADEQANLDKQVLEQFKSVLAESQSSCWQVFEMRFNRFRWRQVPVMYAEGSIDLTMFVDDMSKSDDEPIGGDLQNVLTAYAFCMNEALVKLRDNDISFSRNFFRGRWKTDGTKVWVDDSDDSGKTDRWFKQRLDLNKSLRDCNRNYFPQVQALLPADRQSAFAQVYFAAALLKANDGKTFPATEWLDEVIAMEDLTKEQREAIDAIAIEFRFNAEKATRLVLQAEQRRGDASYSPRTPAESQKLQEETAEAIKHREEIDRRVIDSVWLLLNEQQRLAIERPELGPQ